MKKIELVCKMDDDTIEISEELYNFLKSHKIIVNANHANAQRCCLRITEDTPKITEEFI